MKHTSRSLPEMEMLPSRVMLSATLANGVLTIRGTESDDRIGLSGPWGTGWNSEIWVHESAVVTHKFIATDVRRIRVLGLGGNDRISDLGNGDFKVTLSGGGGNDQISGASGTVIRGGEGADRLDSYGSLANIDDGAGRDTIVANDGRDIITGRSRLHIRADGTAVIRGSKIDDEIGFESQMPRQCLSLGGCGPLKWTFIVGFNGVRRELPLERVNNIVAYLGGGNDSFSIGLDREVQDLNSNGPPIRARVFGGEGNDTILGSSLADEIWGGEGDDSILAGNGNDLVHGGGGNDFVDGEYGADVLRGGAGNDTLTGQFGDDTLIGGNGSDELDGGEGTNVLNPGPE